MVPYQKIFQDARARVRRIAENSVPIIMVGTATCGLAQGARDVLVALKEESRRLGIEADVREVGCLGHCYAEPLVVAKMPGTARYLYGNVTPNKASLLLRRYFKDGDPFLDFLMGSVDPD
ncbi:MAG: (2Fe-2S) ferredoxin domain-containing protein, partial [Thermodesulfobacteriota bacterium]